MFIRCLLLSFLLLIPASAFGQPLWTSPTPFDGITLEAQKPLFSDADGVSFFTSSWIVTGQLALREDVRAGVDIGVSHYAQRPDEPGFFPPSPEDIAETTVSNIGVSIAYDGFFPDLTIIAQGRLPTASNALGNVGRVTGRYADIFRYDAFLADATTASLSGDYSVALDETFNLRARAGLIAQFTGERGANQPARSDALMRYALQGWFEDDDLRIGVGAAGITHLTDEFVGFVERTQVVLGATAIARLGPVEPGMTIQVPMTDELGRQMDASLTLSLGVPLR